MAPDPMDRLRSVLSDYYPPTATPDIVGYLKGSIDPNTWRRMAQTRTEQMLILGNVPPTDAQWAAAGVQGRGGAVQVVRRNDLGNLLITYGGFMIDRPWGKISPMTVELYRSYQNVLDQFSRAISQSSSKKTKLVASMTNSIETIQREYDFVSGEHKQQAGITTGSMGFVSGIAGYWTNHLYNKDVPPSTIWNDCHGLLAHARSTLREGNFADSAKSIIQARSSLLKSSGIYYRWKGGIVGAGQQMEATIKNVAVQIILTFLEIPEVGEANDAGRAVQTLEQSDGVLSRIVTTPEGGITAPQAVSYEQMVEETIEEVADSVRQFKL